MKKNILFLILISLFAQNSSVFGMRASEVPDFHEACQEVCEKNSRGQLNILSDDVLFVIFDLIQDIKTLFLSVPLTCKNLCKLVDAYKRKNTERNVELVSRGIDEGVSLDEITRGLIRRRLMDEFGDMYDPDHNYGTPLKWSRWLFDFVKNIKNEEQLAIITLLKKFVTTLDGQDSHRAISLKFINFVNPENLTDLFESLAVSSMKLKKITFCFDYSSCSSLFSRLYGPWRSSPKYIIEAKTLEPALFALFSCENVEEIVFQIRYDHDFAFKQFKEIKAALKDQSLKITGCLAENDTNEWSLDEYFDTNSHQSYRDSPAMEHGIMNFANFAFFKDIASFFTLCMNENQERTSWPRIKLVMMLKKDKKADNLDSVVDDEIDVSDPVVVEEEDEELDITDVMFFFNKKL